MKFECTQEELDALVEKNKIKTVTDLKIYSGTKLIKAAPMSRGNYNNYRGWEMPSSEDANEEGYLVEYLDGGKPCDSRHLGYISWSPKDVFEKSYRENGSLTFGMAIEALKQGKRVARQEWNGKGIFIFERPADELEVGFIIDKVKSLPQSVKDFFQNIVNSGVNDETKNHMFTEKVKFGAYLCMYAADGSIANGWQASQTDILSEDWEILD